MSDNIYAKDYTLPELMITACAREIKDGERVLIGVGLPLLGAMLAKRTHAPNCKMAYETGSFDSYLEDAFQRCRSGSGAESDFRRTIDGHHDSVSAKRFY